MAATGQHRIRDADGAILAEFESPAGPGLSLVRHDDRQGEIVATTSFVTARPADFGGRP